MNKTELNSLMQMTGLQIGGFLIFEIIVWVLVLGGILPSTLIVKSFETITVSIHISYILLTGLVSVLIASAWLALLAEMGIVKIEKVDLKFLR